MINELYRKALRLYTYYFPKHKGKYTLWRIMVKLVNDYPESLVVELKDGRRLKMGLKYDETWRYLYYFGQRSEIADDMLYYNVIKPGDVVIDVGANIGVTSTLFSRLCGNSGQVHAFEPNPKIFSFLEENVALNEGSGTAKIITNCLCVGDKSAEEVPFYSFSGLGSGMASLSTRERNDLEVNYCKMITLDEYLGSNKIHSVNFIKCDAEGADLFVLQGCKKLLSQECLPIWFIEVAQENTASFGYDARCILDVFPEKDYRLFWVTKKGLITVDRSFYNPGRVPPAGDVLFIPESQLTRLSKIPAR